MYLRGSVTGGNPAPMPYIFFFSPFQVSIGFIPANSRIVVYAANVGSSSSMIGTGLFWGGDFRYVIIPGGVSGGRVMSGAAAGYTVDKLKSLSYDEAARLFNLPEKGSNILLQ
jgi:hypothetical protein